LLKNPNGLKGMLKNTQPQRAQIFFGEFKIKAKFIFDWLFEIWNSFIRFVLLFSKY
jgi:hypothetical protein